MQVSVLQPSKGAIFKVVLITICGSTFAGFLGLGRTTNPTYLTQPVARRVHS